MRLHVQRYIVITLAILLAFVAIIIKLYDIQITAHDDYVAQAESKSTKTLSVVGKRGTIYDANMIPLAYDRLTYNVQFYRDPSATSDEDRKAYTDAIIKTIDLIESNGKKTITGFWLKQDENGQWVFDTGTTSEAVAAKRESQWRANFYLTGVPVEDLFKELCTKYFIDENLDMDMKIKILSIWQESRMYNYLSRPITIAYGVDFETVSEIEVRSTELPGISIAESSERVYPKGALASHIIGYVSKISGEETLKTYQARGYAYDALVGMTGIESSMEAQLTPHIQYKQGKQVVEVNNRGKIVREISNTPAQDGDNVYLTLDTQLQVVLEKALAKNIEGLNRFQQEHIQDPDWRKANRDELRRYESEGIELQLAQSGAAIAMDPNSGKILAMASYPDFDLSMFTGTLDAALWNELITDPRNPMYNRAISTRDTPGSIFKMVTGLGGLMEGVLGPTETISDEGYFTKTDDSYHPKCWININNIYKHANQTIVEGLSHSCNYFFYTVGLKLGSNNITKWAAQLGLTSRTGIELPNESTSFVGNQLMLYDSSRAITDQYTSKPEFSAFMIKKSLRAVGQDRNIKYDEDRLDRVAKKLLDIVAQGGEKETWYAQIREILVNDMNIPSDYIASHFMVNEFTSYLADLQWTPNETIMAAIGQSITQVTPIAVARYVSAIANGGTVYDAQLVDKVVSPTGEVVLDKQPVVVNKIDGDNAAQYLALIRQGMEKVTSVEADGTAANQFLEKDYIAAKTGTSQRTKIDIENNAWLVTYAPKEDPQIVVVIYVQNGYAGARLANSAIATIDYYLNNQKSTENLSVPISNSLAD